MPPGNMVKVLCRLQIWQAGQAFASQHEVVYAAPAYGAWTDWAEYNYT